VGGVVNRGGGLCRHGREKVRKESLVPRAATTIRVDQPALAPPAAARLDLRHEAVALRAPRQESRARRRTFAALDAPAAPETSRAARGRRDRNWPQPDVPTPPPRGDALVPGLGRSMKWTAGVISVISPRRSRLSRRATVKSSPLPADGSPLAPIERATEATIPHHDGEPHDARLTTVPIFTASSISSFPPTSRARPPRLVSSGTPDRPRQALTGPHPQQREALASHITEASVVIAKRSGDRVHRERDVRSQLSTSPVASTITDSPGITRRHESAHLCASGSGSLPTPRSMLKAAGAASRREFTTPVELVEQRRPAAIAAPA